MAPWKALGPDGFPPGFFQHFWNHLSINITSLVRDCFNGDIDLSQFCFLTKVEQSYSPSPILVEPYWALKHNI